MRVEPCGPHCLDVPEVSGRDGPHWEQDSPRDRVDDAVGDLEPSDVALCLGRGTREDVDGGDR